MEAILRRLLTIGCRGALLGASLDQAEGATAILIATGGSQTRVGSHRLFERLAAGLAGAGHPCLRFDRRGVGDSSGADPGFRDTAPDIAAAATALREQMPQVTRVIGLGLCDGATALVLNGASAGVDGLILLNPWLVEAEPDRPPPAAIRRHYWRRVTSFHGWRKIASGAVSYSKLFKGIARAAAGSGAGSPLTLDAAAALRRRPVPTALILAAGDATAIAAAAEIKVKAFAGLIGRVQTIQTDSHTFARPGDGAALLAAVLGELTRL